MTPSEYQKITDTTALYPGEGTMLGLTYTTLGAAGEAGEIANKVKKLLRDEKRGMNEPLQVLTLDTSRQLLDESGDVLWYLTRIAVQLGSSLEELMMTNAHKLLLRRQAGKIEGSGDER